MMKLRREKALWNVLLGTSVFLLDSLRNRLSEGADEIADRARDVYEEGSRRAGRAVDVVRGNDHTGLKTTAALLAGVGVGFGVAMLFAPASGRETRDAISGKVQEFGDRVRGKFTSETRDKETGTYGA
jgi:hypothetical protein